MKAIFLVFCGLSFALLVGAQTKESFRQGDARVAAPSSRDIVPLPSIRTLTTAQAAGKKLFVQRCSVCHLPALPSYTAYGPLLDRNLVEDRGDEAIRLQIMQGSARMPGFQYTLSPAEIDHIGEYLKTLGPAKREKE